MKKLIVTCVTLAIVLTAGSDVFAKSKKYYRYDLKAYPAVHDSNWLVRNVMGWLGDHTYVCIKGMKKKRGKKYKTTKNYGCFARVGGKSGGKTRSRWAIQKSSSAKAGKNGALCTAWKYACYLDYGFDGVCHQHSNQVLYGARSVGAVITWGIRGYNDRFQSRRKYGTHGRWSKWLACRKACYGS